MQVMGRLDPHLGRGRTLGKAWAIEDKVFLVAQGYDSDSPTYVLDPSTM